MAFPVVGLTPGIAVVGEVAGGARHQFLSSRPARSALNHLLRLGRLRSVNLLLLRSGGVVDGFRESERGEEDELADLPPVEGLEEGDLREADGVAVAREEEGARGTPADAADVGGHVICVQQLHRFGFPYIDVRVPTAGEKVPVGRIGNPI